jgi:hypothetical protein
LNKAHAIHTVAQLSLFQQWMNEITSYSVVLEECVNGAGVLVGEGEHFKKKSNILNNGIQIFSFTKIVTNNIIYCNARAQTHNIRTTQVHTCLRTPNFICVCACICVFVRVCAVYAYPLYTLFLNVMNNSIIFFLFFSHVMKIFVLCGITNYN